jgi:hypothetical protein
MVLAEARYELNNEDCTPILKEVIHYFRNQSGRDATQYEKEAYKLYCKMKTPKKEQMELFSGNLLIY